MKTVTDKFGDIRTYNEHNELVHCKYTCGLEVWWEYDEKGNDKSMRDNRGYSETYGYDANGVLITHCNNGKEQWTEKWE